MTGLDADDELPTLTFELARDLGEFPEFDLHFDEDELADYHRIVGSTPTEVLPPGIAAIFGRLGYLRKHAMPGGGVLLGQEITWLAPASASRPLRIKSVVESAVEDDRGRRQIVFVTTARQDDTHVATVRIKAGWPS
ncbi:hypothetical protein [Nocardioides sp. GXZ039]|uniref:hypothetical protein n=1 Tax=Nocardioides sp. GXZ039 TaxID=3136018 RepID=UPI0030F37F80